MADATGGHRTRSGARSNELLLNGVLVAHGRGELIGTDDGGELTLLSTPQARDRRGAPKDGYCLSSLPRDALELAASGWGKYEPSVRRWEALTRPAPNPTEPDSSGVKARIRSEFSEWMMGWPAGWVTDLQLTRTEKLVCIGNGVVPQQAVAALRWLLSVSEVAA
ncbi:Gp69 (fragment) [uncultured Mycobacterium sp.]|uniref:Gp69 n=1 Tax=uncultured Mycobacterium sp. TaxID=171292 RepID=A0A1Y5P5A0_9MYCO